MATARTPPSNLGVSDTAQGYPSRRTLPQPMDAAAPCVPPPDPSQPLVPQMTAAPPPRPGTPGPEAAHFYPGAIPGEQANAHGERERMTRS